LVVLASNSVCQNQCKKVIIGHLKQLFWQLTWVIQWLLGS